MSNLFFKKVNLAIMKNFNQSSLARFFTRFPKLLFAGLMYSIPFAVFSGIFILISFLSGFNNVILWSLGIIPAMPFYSGLVMVIRKISVEKEDVNVFKTFSKKFWVSADRHTLRDLQQKVRVCLPVQHEKDIPRLAEPQQGTGPAFGV